MDKLKGREEVYEVRRQVVRRLGNKIWMKLFRRCTKSRLQTLKYRKLESVRLSKVKEYQLRK